MKPFDPKKPCQTRDGRKVIIYCTDAPGDCPIHGRIEGQSRPDCWRITGIFAPESLEMISDLVNIPEKIIRWINVYNKSGEFLSYKSKAEADYAAGSRRTACIKVEFEEGEGL